MRAALVTLLLCGSAFGSGYDKLIEAPNKTLGMTMEQVRAGWGEAYANTKDSITFVTPRISHDPGTPARAVTRERGHISRHGNYSGSAETISTPATAARTYRWDDRVIFRFDISGIAYRWEIWNAVGDRDSNGRSIWTISEARELVRNGSKTKIVKVGKFRGILH